ncbi:hypothetical protein MTATph1_CDS0226 [Moorella phage MTATph1]
MAGALSPRRSALRTAGIGGPGWVPFWGEPDATIKESTSFK